MQNLMQTIDWRHPQRQPAAALLLIILQKLGEVLKSFWPFLLLALLRGKPGKAGLYEIIGAAIILLSVLPSIGRFFYFRFYIEKEKLILKSGWLKKTTTVIPLANIQTVEVTQGPLHQVMSLVRLSIDTAGTEKTEAGIEALRRPMAEALRRQLLQLRQAAAVDEAGVPEEEELFLHLTDKDIFKLSISANHLRALAIFLLFARGLIESFTDEERFLPSWLMFLPGGNVYAYLFLGAAVLLITLLVSSADVFLRYHEFSVVKKSGGFYIRSGLFQLKERLLARQKVQYVSWRAGWLRRRLGLWMLEYHIAGSDEADQKAKLRVPVTRAAHLPLLVGEYRTVPVLTTETPIRVHPAYILFRFVRFGLLPALLVLPFCWQAAPVYKLLLVSYAVLLFITFWLHQRKYRLWALDDVLYIERGSWGQEKVLLCWHKLQYVELQQSRLQRRKGLASVDIETAGGLIRIPFIPLPAARQLVNFALYKTETNTEGWL